LKSELKVFNPGKTVTDNKQLDDAAPGRLSAADIRSREKLSTASHSEQPLAPPKPGGVLSRFVAAETGEPDVPEGVIGIPVALPQTALAGSAPRDEAHAPPISRA
jgi:hypothetical protein